MVVVPYGDDIRLLNAKNNMLSVFSGFLGVRFQVSGASCMTEFSDS
jgi:hypothetical protein